MEQFPPVNFPTNFLFSSPNKQEFSNTLFLAVDIEMLTLYSLYTQVMLILVLIDIQYLQNVASSSEKSLNDQNDSSLNSHHPIKNFPNQKFPCNQKIVQFWLYMSDLDLFNIKISPSMKKTVSI